MIVKVVTTEVHKFLTDAKNFLIEEAKKGNACGMGDIPDYMWEFVCSKVTDIKHSNHFSGLYDITGTVAESDPDKKEMKPEKENVQYLWMVPAVFYVKDDVTGTDGLSFIETLGAANAFINEMQVLIGLNMADDVRSESEADMPLRRSTLPEKADDTVPDKLTDLDVSLFYVTRTDRCLGVTAV